MEDLLKFQRIEGVFDSIVKDDRICCSNIDTNHIVLGTESGKLHVINFHGKQLKSFRPCKTPITDIDVDYSNGLTIASCSGDGTVVVLSINSEETKENTFRFNTPLNKICLEKSSSPSGKKECSFIVGATNGKLIYHRSAWFSHKDIVLFTGSGSAVSSIAWKENLIAWADATYVRIMDISTQTAVCHFNPPQGVGVDDPYPCRLFWQSEQELLIGWADSYRFVRVTAVTADLPPGAASSATAAGGVSIVRTAKTVHQWQTDCIICGVYPFDADHVVVLGYHPPCLDEEEGDTVAAAVTSSKISSSGSAQSKDKDNRDDDKIVTLTMDEMNQPEVMICNRATGEVVSADLLPLRGGDEGLEMNGPNSYHLLCTYACQESSADCLKWDCMNSRQTRGGDRGMAPICFVVSPQDFVVVRVRDVNDRVANALSNQDLKAAAELAKSDKTSLKVYRFNELIRVYITDLLDQNQADLAAKELVRLIGNDRVLWENWVYKFIEYNQLHCLSMMIPVENPRLPNIVYEQAIRGLLSQNPRAFLNTMKKWAKIQPPLFDHTELLSLLEHMPRRTAESSYLEAQAQLYIVSGSYERALACYLEIRVQPATDTDGNGENESHSTLGGTVEAAAGGGGVGVGGVGIGGGEERDSVLGPESNFSLEQNLDKSDYRHVFDLIEKQNLFSSVESRIINLVRLSKPLSARLLITNIEKLPIKSIVRQLKSDRKLLHWYLHVLFVNCYQIYAQEEYADLHALQVELYAEYAPVFKRPVYVSSDEAEEAKAAAGLSSSSTSCLSSSSSSSSPPSSSSVAVLPQRFRRPDSYFLTFLKSGLAPLDVALSACKNRGGGGSPLFYEIVYILSKKGLHKEALHVHLIDIGDVGLAIDFVESCIEEEQNKSNLDDGSGGGGGSGIRSKTTSMARVGRSFADLPIGRDSSEYASASSSTSNQSYSATSLALWDDLVAFALRHNDFLIRLMDFLGICQIDPTIVLHRISPHVHIPYLRKKLMRIIRQQHFQVFSTDKCAVALEHDALALLRQQNQGQRRAMKVQANRRCSFCLRPLFMEANTSSGNSNFFLIDRSHLDKSQVQVWGPQATRLNKDYHAAVAAASGGGVGVGSRGGNPSGATSGAVLFSNKLAFHKFCYERLQN